MTLFDVYPLFNINIQKAKGCHVWDDKGTQYLDMYGGHAVISVGHSHPTYVEAIQRQIEKLGFYSNSIINPLQEELAHKLGQISGYADYQLFLTNSGAEANENALKVASFATNKKRIIAFRNAFHGRTSAAVRITDNPAIVAPINEDMPVTFVNLEDTQTLEQELSKGDVAAVIIEGIQGIAGIITPTNHFLTTLQNLCKKHNATLILDEIQSGYGRSGKFFAHQHCPNLKPDIITIAKGMGNGFPIGGVMISPDFTPRHGMLGTTFGGNHLACAAAIAVIDIMQNEKLTDNAANIGNHLMQALSNAEGLKELRGKGLMIGIELEESVKEKRNNLLHQHKTFTGVAGTNTIRLLPPLSLSITEAQDFINRYNA